MKKTKNDGFILFMVVSLLPLMGLAMILLSTNTRLLLAETNMSIRQTNKKNLAASAAAWANYNSNTPGKLKPLETIKLDVSKLDIPQAFCNVTLNNVTKKGNNMEIYSSFKWRKSQIKHSLNYTVK